MASYTRLDLQENGIEPLFRLLIDAAHNGKKITYKRVAEFLESELDIPKVFSTHIGGVAGTLMNRLLEMDDELPLINLLVVSSSDQLPGIGANWYLKHHFGRRARFADDDRVGPKRLQLVQEATNAVYVYEDWERQYELLFGNPYKQSILGAENDGQGDNPRLNLGLPESEEHKALKRYVLENPKLVLQRSKGFSGKLEVGLSSGDRLDVFFASQASQVAVEVKSRRSNSDDKRRGIFQCIKYRAVLEAQCLNLDVNVDAVLVVEEELPSDLAALAGQLGVQWKVLRVPD